MLWTIPVSTLGPPARRGDPDAARGLLAPHGLSLTETVVVERDCGRDSGVTLECEYLVILAAKRGEAR